MIMQLIFIELYMLEVVVRPKQFRQNGTIFDRDLTPVGFD